MKILGDSETEHQVTHLDNQDPSFSKHLTFLLKEFPNVLSLACAHLKMAMC